MPVSTFIDIDIECTSLADLGLKFARVPSPPLELTRHTLAVAFKEESGPSHRGVGAPAYWQCAPTTNTTATTATTSNTLTCQWDTTVPACSVLVGVGGTSTVGDLATYVTLARYRDAVVKVRVVTPTASGIPLQ